MKKIFSLIIIIISANAWTQTQTKDFEITKVSLRGDGCKNYEPSKVLSTDQTQLSVLFDDFNVTYPPRLASTGPSDYRMCNIGINFVTQKNIKITKLEVEYDLRGYTYLQPGIDVNLMASIISITKKKNGENKYSPVATKTENLIAKKWGHPKAEFDVDESWTIQESKTIDAPFTCVKDDQTNWQISINNRMMLYAHSKAFQNKHVGQVYVDTADFKSRIKLKATYQYTQNCQ